MSANLGQTRTDAIMALVRSGLTNAAIARELDMKPGHIQSLRYYAVNRRAEARKRYVPGDVFDRLVPAAKRRGVSVRLLAKCLLEAIVNDDLVDVVLSDGDELAALETALAAVGGG